MAKTTLSKGAVKTIEDAVDKLFDRAIARFLERPPTDKRIVIGFTPRMTLPGLFEAASIEERNKVDTAILDSLLNIAQGFIESQRASTKAHTVKTVQSWLTESYASKEPADFETVLEGELAKVWGKATTGMHRIIASESNNVRNTGTLDGIIKVNVAEGIEDPIVYFVVVRDEALCKECKRLHLLEGGVTPKVWYLSELKHGYHTLTDDIPSLGGEHPHCRCSLVTLMPGYGFEGGSVTFIALDHDEMKKQRG